MTAVGPVLPGFHPDPSVCRVGDTYYLVTSTFEYAPGHPVYASEDLVHWRPVGAAVPDGAALGLPGAGDSRGLYAPTLRHHDGVFYLASTLVDGAGSFYVTATDPAGPWSEPVVLPDAAGIDPSLHFDEDGRCWWLGTRPVEPGDWPGHTEIWLRELDLATGALTGEEHVLWSGAQRNAWWSEGPHLYRRDGWHYLVTAEGGTEFNHSVVVARSRSLTGPYEGDPANPVLTHRHLGRGVPVQSVGHADLVEAADGSWWAVLLGTRPVAGRTVLGRETFLARVEWQDGWPVFNPGEGRLVPVGDILAGGTDADATPGTPTAPAEPSDPLTPGPLASTSGWLGVRGLPPDPGALRAGDRLLRRLVWHDAELALQLDLTPGATAGLLLRQNDDHTLRVEAARERGALVVRAVSRAAGAESIVAEEHIEETGTVVFRAALGRERAEFQVETDEDLVPLGSAGIDVLSTEVAGGFVGTTVGAFVAAGSARADWFDQRAGAAG